MTIEVPDYLKPDYWKNEPDTWYHTDVLGLPGPIPCTEACYFCIEDRHPKMLAIRHGWWERKGSEAITVIPTDERVRVNADTLPLEPGQPWQEFLLSWLRVVHAYEGQP